MRTEAGDGPATGSGECDRIPLHPDNQYLQREIPILPSFRHALNQGTVPRHLSDFGTRVAGR